MKKHGKGLTSQDFFMEDSKGVFQTEAVVELRNKLTKRKKSQLPDWEGICFWSFKEIIDVTIKSNN